MAKPVEAFGLDGVKTYDEATVFLAGIECEIESVLEGQAFPGFTATSDGSLRNHGIEFISKPFTVPQLLKHFENLHANIKFFDRSVAFSPRTSTHVHINCRSLSLEQVKNLLLLYALYEEFFFSIVSPVRRGNIHCVPLTDTHLPSVYGRDTKSLIANWHKYTALNLLPLGKQGTVEFRHLQGTGSGAELREWLLTLQNLWRTCQEDILTREVLLDRKQLFALWQKIFCDSPKARAQAPLFDGMIKNSLIDVKLSFC